MGKLVGIISSFYLYLFTAVASFATIHPTPTSTPRPNITPFTLNDPADLAGTTSTTGVIQFIINLLFAVGIVLALAFLIWGGVRWVFSRGNKEKVEEARQHIIAAIVGLIFVVGAFVIINIALQLLTGQNITEFLQFPVLKGLQ